MKKSDSERSKTYGWIKYKFNKCKLMWEKWDEEYIFIYIGFNIKLYKKNLDEDKKKNKTLTKIDYTWIMVSMMVNILKLKKTLGQLGISSLVM